MTGQILILLQMLRKSIGLITLVGLLIFGIGCSKENNAVQNPSSSELKDAPAFPTDLDGILSVVEDFTDDIYEILENDSSSSIVTDTDLDYAILLMEATFNYQHANLGSDIEKVHDQELVEYELEIELGSGTSTLHGAAMAEAFIDALDYFEGELSGEQFYMSIDFHVSEVTSTVAKVSVSALKVLTFGIAYTPIGPDDDWFAVNNVGKCDWSVSTGDAAKRMSPIVHQMNYTLPYTLFRYYFHTHINKERVGFAPQHGGSWYGSKSGNYYCQYVYGVDPAHQSPCGIIKLTFNNYSVPCVSDTEISDYISHMDDIVDYEKPTNKVFIGSVCIAANSYWDPNANWNYAWHRFEARYGIQADMQTGAPVNLRASF